jgi:hypothetical protein
MRFGVVTPRLLMKAGCVAALWLLSVSASSAAPGPRRNIVGRACSAQSVPVHNLARQPKSFGGPVARPSQRALVGLSDVTARLKRATRAGVGDDDEAIQSDASAARIESDDRTAPALRELGILHGSFDRLPPPHIFSPRSPRGPPIPT